MFQRLKLHEIEQNNCFTPGGNPTLDSVNPPSAEDGLKDSEGGRLMQHQRRPAALEWWTTWPPQRLVLQVKKKKRRKREALRRLHR